MVPVPPSPGVTAASQMPMVAWLAAHCAFGSDCPVEITNTATLATVSIRSPPHHGFTSTGVTFSPGGTRLAAWARAASFKSQCCANQSELAIINASTGTVHLIPAARLVTMEDAGWICGCPAASDCWPAR